MPLFDHSAETYDEWCTTPLGSFVDGVEKQLMIEVSKPQSGEKALDIGCGTGINSLLLSSQILAGLLATLIVVTLVQKA